MGAPKNAITLMQEADSKWWEKHGDELPSFHCEYGCGYRGHAGELLVSPDDDETTMWCPICTTTGWIWD